MQAFHNFLKQFPHYRPKVFDAVLPFLETKELETGDFLLEQGKICRHISFIESGLVRLYYLNDGKEVTYCFCRENEITTAYSSLISQKESELSIQAVESCKLIMLKYEALQKLYATDLFWQQVGRLAAEREFMRTDCHNRFLRDHSAMEKYQSVLDDDPELLQRVPLNHLATYLQIAPETLSRIRKKLSRT